MYFMRLQKALNYWEVKSNKNITYTESKINKVLLRSLKRFLSEAFLFYQKKGDEKSENNRGKKFKQRI